MFEIANLMLIRHSPFAPLCHFFLIYQGGWFFLSGVYIINKIVHGCSCSTHYLTRSLRLFVRYRVERTQEKFHIYVRPWIILYKSYLIVYSRGSDTEYYVYRWPLLGTASNKKRVLQKHGGRLLICNTKSFNLLYAMHSLYISWFAKHISKKPHLKA